MEQEILKKGTFLVLKSFFRLSQAGSCFYWGFWKMSVPVWLKLLPNKRATALLYFTEDFADIRKCFTESLSVSLCSWYSERNYTKHYTSKARVYLVFRSTVVFTKMEDVSHTYADSFWLVSGLLTSALSLLSVLTIKTMT